MIGRRWVARAGGYAAALACAVVAVACGATPEADDGGPPVPASWLLARSSPGHVVHVTYGGIPCRDCHDDGFAAPPADVCDRCHDDVRSPLHEAHAADGLGTARPACLDCHGYAANTPARPWACMRCHDQAQGAFVAPVGAHQGEHCGSCHRAHESPSLQPRPCAECHADQVAQGGKHGAQTLSADSCLDCHRTHEPALAASAGCVTCHAAQKKQPIGERSLFAGHDQCTTCHQPHRFARADVRACADCHGGVRVVAERRHGECTTCHQPHQAAAPRACTSCHRGAVKHPPPTPGDACAGCHPPHGASAGRTAGRAVPLAVACTACHQQVNHGPATCRDTDRKSVV